MPIAGLTSDSTKETQTGNRLPIVGLTSDSKQANTHRKQTDNGWSYVRLQTTNTNKETEYQSLDLHRTPSTPQIGNRMPIAGLTSDSKHTTNRKRMPIAGLISNS